MSKFTAQIDMSNFFEDERKLVLLLVDPEIMFTVRDLQRKVEGIFGLENVGIRCQKTGCYILPQETVDIVQLVKVLQVFTLTKSVDDASVKPKKTKKLKVKNATTEEEEFAPIPAQTISTPAPELPAHQTHQKKRKYFDDCHSTKSNEITSTSEQQHPNLTVAPAANKSKKAKTRATAEDLRAAIASASAAVEEEEAENTKLKRKRMRSHSKNLQTQKNVSGVQHYSIDKSAVLCNSSQHHVAARDTNITHVYFNETGENITATATSIITSKTFNASHNKTTAAEQHINNADKSPAAKIIFHCELNEMSSKEVRTFTVKPTTKRSSNSSINNNARQKSPIVIQEHIVIKPLTKAALPVVQTVHKDNSFDATETEASQLQQQLQESSVGSIVSLEHEEEPATARDLTLTLPQTSTPLSAAITTIAIPVLEVVPEEDEDQEEEEEPSNFDSSEVFTVNTSDIYNESHIRNRYIEPLSASQQMEQSSLKDLDVTPKITVERIMPLSVPLNKLPDIGDVVLFKIAISNFIAGKCEYINKRTKMIKLYIIDGHSELEHLPSKYFCNLDDSQTIFINVKLSDMLEARVFQMS